jgi:hypothetical protein
MVIKPAGKIALIILFLVLAFFTYRYFVPKTDTTVAETEKTENGSPSSSGSESNSGSVESKSAETTTKSSSSESRSFNYVPEKPVNGVLRGVVEVGASGFNSFVINMDREKRWEIVSKDFGESLAYEGLMTTEDIRAGLKKYLAGMFEKGVSSKNMHFVISSGAQKEPKTMQISNELKKMGFVVNNVTAEQEGKYALRATVPPNFIDNSFLVDIGSGNTKISWTEGDNRRSLEVEGSKYYADGKSDAVVYDAVKSQVAKIPEAKRNVCFIIGGVPFTLAKQHRSGEERFTVLKAPADYKGSDKKMASGINIYKAIQDGTKCDTFVFDWDANFTIGFLLSLP